MHLQCSHLVFVDWRALNRHGMPPGIRPSTVCVPDSSRVSGKQPVELQEQVMGCKQSMHGGPPCPGAALGVSVEACSSL